MWCGKRLGSIQKNAKAIVLVKKKLLEHLIIQLKNLGIEKIYLLVKTQFFKKYFKNGKNLSRNYYSFNEPDKETGYR